MKCSVLFVMSVLASFTLSLRAYCYKLGNFNFRVRSLSMKHSTSLSHSPPPNVLVPVADGSEEMETVTIVDILVRGGAKVTLAAVGSASLQVTCSRGVKLVADKFMSECATDSWTMIVCPGGEKGAHRLRDCSHLGALLAKQHAEGKYVAAICAAPAVVLSHIVTDRRLTCYPAEKFIHLIAATHQHSTDTTVVDGHVVTSQGPGTAVEFSLKLVEVLFGVEVAERVKKEMVANG